MTNKMAEVAKVFGVELGEEFQIKYKDTIVYGTFRFTEKGTETKGSSGWESARPALLRLLTGEYEIVKMPYQPKKGETYWTCYSNDFAITALTWCDWVQDFALLKCGAVFRTEAEAIKARPRIYKELTGKEWTE